LAGIERPLVGQVLDIHIVDTSSIDLLELVQALDADLEQRYPNHLMVGLPAASGGLFVVAYLGGDPVGCGALRELGPEVGEIKRMFVLVRTRRRGIARHVLKRLETEAARRGYSKLLLESGVRQPEALALYESCGYRRIPSFGEYVGSKLSVCFEKSLR
jgi:putative acetyltransferase